MQLVHHQIELSPIAGRQDDIFQDTFFSFQELQSFEPLLI